jgi:aspartyl-tRNA(Asn)/glutamyl-tRNA(Gln) amidotransferase subunit A
MTDLTGLTATELSSLYQSGTVSPVTVAEQVLAKIERLNPTLNAFCFTDPDTTLKQAQHSEHRWQNGQPLSQLDGVPIAVKDSILTQGWPTLHGSLAIDPNQPWLEDAPAVAQLREAGAVFVGKTTVPEFSWGTTSTISQAHGVTVNPWDIKCSSGGSSGGSAVAVSSSLVPLAIGTDMGGSITVPGSFCGVFGYKPSAGKVAHSPRDAVNLSTPGVFANSTVDLIATVNIISKVNANDWFHIPSTEIKLNSAGQFKSLSVGLDIGIYHTGVHTELWPAFDKLKSLWQTQSIDTLQQFNLQLALEIFNNLALSIQLNQWQALTQEQQSITEKHTQKTAILAHTKINLYHWLSQRVKFGTSINQHMQEFDVIVVPSTAVSASSIQCDTVPTTADTNISPWSTLCAVVGLPSVTVPVGLDAQGLPVAVMIIGPMHGDELVLQVAQAIEQQFPMPICPVIL